MKIRNLLFALLAIAFVAVSCTNNATTESKPKDVSLDTRGVEAEKPTSHVAGTWKNATTMINLKIDGTFEASFEDNVTVVGKWSLSNDEKTLSLTEDTSSEGKGQSFNKTYTVIELSDAMMHVEDADGNKLELKAE